MPVCSLRDRKRINEIFEKGTKVVSSSFVLFFMANDLGSLRLCPVASKKSFKTAVSRNLAKRRLRHLCRLQKLEGYDLIMIARNYVIEKEFIKLQSEFEKCLSKNFQKI